MKKPKIYEIRPSGEKTGVRCPVCREEVIVLVYVPGDVDYGVCGCPMTFWGRVQESGHFLRTQPGLSKRPTYTQQQMKNWGRWRRRNKK